MGTAVAHARVLIDIDELASRLSIAKGTLYNFTYPSDQPLWRIKVKLADIGVDGNWITELPGPSCVAAVLQAV